MKSHRASSSTQVGLTYGNRVPIGWAKSQELCTGLVESTGKLRSGNPRPLNILYAMLLFLIFPKCNEPGPINARQVVITHIFSIQFLAHKVSVHPLDTLWWQEELPPSSFSFFTISWSAYRYTADALHVPIGFGNEVKVASPYLVLVLQRQLWKTGFFLEFSQNRQGAWQEKKLQFFYLFSIKFNHSCLKGEINGNSYLPLIYHATSIIYVVHRGKKSCWPQCRGDWNSIFLTSSVLLHPYLEAWRPHGLEASEWHFTYCVSCVECC